MNPPDTQLWPGKAIDFGIPYLWGPIHGLRPGVTPGALTPDLATCPKLKAGQLFQFKLKALEDIPSGVEWTCMVEFARARTEEKIREVVGVASIPISFILDTNTYVRPAVPVTLDEWDTLPGGRRQPKPQIFPWCTWATNKEATTLGEWYDFDYETGYVADKFMDLHWNLVEKTEAYIVKALGVTPHANSLATRLWVEGRITNPEYKTRPLPEENAFWPALYKDTTVNEKVHRAGLVKLPKPFLFHGVKGGIQHVDNRTATIPADGVRLDVVGTKFILK